ncbi:hypothetical protein [Candidatus Similichlamydia epinepheli]|uniref:hypothetical protein n=1 Tax=Candidatus Similichlamydia epinepheli TaxID=1903953 RepID=UPI000D387E81|nr:hypothetical protein [Candidatus Similichlamydia epinepheli]
MTFQEGGLSKAQVSTTLSAIDLVQHLDFLNSAGLIPIKEEALDEMRGPHVGGEVKLSFLFDRKKEALVFDANSPRLKLGGIDLDHLAIHGEKRGDCFSLERFEAGSLKIQGDIIYIEGGWYVPGLTVFWKKSSLKSGMISYSEQNHFLQVPLEQLSLNLGELAILLPQMEVNWDYLQGTLLAKGELLFDFTKGWKGWALNSKLYCIGEEFGKGRLKVESPDLLHITYGQNEGFSLKNADFNFLHRRSAQLWAKCHFGHLNYFKGKLKGEGIKVIIPPEMVHFLGQTHSLPYLNYEEEKMIVFNYPLTWENQIEASLDFEFDKESRVSGFLKEGYYWIGDKAWYLSSCSFAYQKNGLEVQLNTLYNEMPFELTAQLSSHPHFTSIFTIQETCNEHRGEEPLVIQTDWNANEGFFIQSIDGGVYGLDFSFYHNPRASFSDRMALTGQMKINVPKLAQLFGQSIKERVIEFEIGKGYELSGNLIISKTDLKESRFTGYLKGKHFQLMGTLMETLMSEIDACLSHIELHRFTISDESGVFAIKSVEIAKREEGWSLNIPEVVITDFRPSLLKKIGKYPTRIKPLTIRELRAFNIDGILGDASSFSGKGTLNFINTFKRDYHILDIPFEILGRLGLDMGLFIPIRGDLEYIIVDRRFYFTQLKNSYSEGKRSQFYLSPIEHSFIDFDGNININIRMKQYVLLKVTEPFTLSIGGTFENPKYSLH